MLNFRFIFIINILLFFVSNSYSQAPGYLGKRLFVEGNLGINTGLAFVSRVNSWEDGTEKYKSLRPAAKISVNWVYNRHRYFALEAGHQQFLTTQTPLLSFPDQPALKYRISTQSVGVGFFKTQRKTTTSLAPLGFFFGYKFTYSQSTATPVRYSNSNEKFDGVEKAAYNLNFERPELRFLGMAVSSGYRTILKDKFTLNYALDFGCDFTINKEDDNNDNVYAFSRGDLIRNNSLYFHLTIGGGILLY